MLYQTINYASVGGGGPSPYQPSSVGGAWSGQPPPHQHTNRPHTDLPNLAALGSSLGLTAATAGSPAPPGAAQLTSMGAALNLGALPVGSALVAAALNQAGWGGLFSSLQGPQAPPPQQQQQQQPQQDGSGGPGSYPVATQQQQQAMAIPAPGSNGPAGASGLLGWGESPGQVNQSPAGVQQQQPQQQQQAQQNSAQAQQQQQPWSNQRQQEG